MDKDKISQLIKEIRLNNHLTQKQFGDKYNVTYQAVNKWETHRRIPDIEILKQICKDNKINIKKLELKEPSPEESRIKETIITIILIAIVIITIIFIIKNT